jgi:hypothetical protein
VVEEAASNGELLMAKAKGSNTTIAQMRVKKKTSIGKSSRSRPKSKHQKLSHKKYRGQGK